MGTESPIYARAALALMVAAGVGGSWLALRSARGAILVMLPVAALCPWMGPMRAGEAGVMLPLAATCLWALWMCWENVSRNRGKATVVELAAAGALAAAAVAAAPASIVVLAAAAAYYIFANEGRRSIPRAAVVLGVPVVYLIAANASAVMELGKAGDARFWYTLVVTEGWSTRATAQGYAYALFEKGQAGVNTWFYVPLLPVFLAMTAERAKEWWFWPTLLWGAVLALCSVVIGGEGNVQYSVTLALGVFVPVGVAAVREWTG